jgi:hypothetical protein
MDYDHAKNWGMSGLGNRAIAERVAEAHAKHKFTADDTVIVQWSSHLRNDWWHQYPITGKYAGWQTAGSIFNYINERIYDLKWIKTFFFEPAYFMHTLNHIVLTQGLLKSTGCTWYMTSIGDVRNMGADIRDNEGIGEDSGFIKPEEKSLDKVAWHKVPELRVYEKSIWEDNAAHWLEPLETFAQQHKELTFEFLDTKRKNKTFYDTHPSTMQHYLWVESELQEKLQLSDATRKTAREIAEVVNKLHDKFKFNKNLFELGLAKRTDFPVAASHKLKWPFPYEGF